MAYTKQTSFSAGELDPALHERTNLEKYQSGLKTARNVYVGKTGRIINRSGRRFMRETKYANRQCIIVAGPYSQYLIEWGHLYVRQHDTVSNTYTETSHDWTEFDLPNVQFEFTGRHVWVSCVGKKQKKMVVGPLDISDPYLDSRFLSDGEKFYWFYPGSVTLTVGISGSSGYLVEYIVTGVYKGQESLGLGATGASLKLPLSTTESNTMNFNVGTNAANLPQEIRVYRRPAGGNAFGYVGSGIGAVLIGSDYVMQFTDRGQEADYTHSPPSLYMVTPDPTWVSGPIPIGPVYAYPRCCLVYQQSLLLTNYQNEEIIYKSRTGYQNLFTREYPFSDDSSLVFKSGTSGNAKVLRMYDNGNLLVFTTIGIFVNEGPLTPDNLTMMKKGNWVIDERVSPLAVPGSLLFVDKATNTVRSLIYSNEAGGYLGEEVSIFSNHLFQNKRIISWAFQDGDIPLVWACFDDGSCATLTYQREHQMQAWTHHDSGPGVKYESVATIKNYDNVSTAYFVVNHGNARWIEYTTPRSITDVKEFCGMDAAVYYNGDIGALAGGARINVDAWSDDDWEGKLVITSDFATFSNVANYGAPGTVFRFFDNQGSAVDLTVTDFINYGTLYATPNVEFPFDQGQNATLYMTYSVLTGLDHLNGKLVSLMVDGYVKSSPNNNVEDFPEIEVVGGQITIPDGKRGAFVHVGLPYTSDVETLDIDTAEQKPVLIEDIICRRLFMKIYKTLGLFIAQSFPRTDNVDGMVNPTGSRIEDNELGNIAYAAQQPITTRLEISIPNDWKSQGRICVRQVDPIPFEILSIIPDINVS